MRRTLHLGGILDRYVARLFALSYLSAFLLVVGMFLIVDMAVNLDVYTRPNRDGSTPSSLVVASYYAHQLPFLYLQMSPYVALMAGMFTAAKMTRFNELVAALNAGVGIRRLMAPVFAGAAILAVGMFTLREWATGELGERRDALQFQLRNRSLPVYRNFWIWDEAGRRVRLNRYFPSSDEGEPPRFDRLSCMYTEGARRVSLYAARGTQLEDGTWEVEGGQRFEWDGTVFRPSSFEVLEELRFSERDVHVAWKGKENPLDLSFSESRELLVRDPTNSRYRTLYNYHMTFPLAGLVLLLVGLPFMVSQERGRAAERVGKGFFLCVCYFGLDFVCGTLGLQGQIGPLHAAWLPVLSFGALGTALFGFMRS